ncbi:MAG: hypothetical protein HUK40_17300 [Desulfobacter sp.]|nr:hypothetical protein [Desulfobacter sp.]
MFILILIAVFVSLIIGIFIVRFKTDNKRSTGPILGVFFLIIQAAYLLLVVFENTLGSETWIGLALTYIPLAIFFFVILAFVCLNKAMKLKNKKQYLITCGTLTFHGVGSYLILILWAEIFKLPL